MDTIYLLKDQVGNFKIGFTTKEISERKTPLLTGNSGDLEVIYEHKTKHKRRVETALHNKFRFKRVVREFFELDNYDVETFPETCQSIEETYDALKKFGNPFY